MQEIKLVLTHGLRADHCHEPPGGHGASHMECRRGRGPRLRGDCRSIWPAGHAISFIPEAAVAQSAMFRELESNGRLPRPAHAPMEILAVASSGAQIYGPLRRPLVHRAERSPCRVEQGFGPIPLDISRSTSAPAPSRPMTRFLRCSKPRDSAAARAPRPAASSPRCRRYGQAASRILTAPVPSFGKRWEPRLRQHAALGRFLEVAGGPGRPLHVCGFPSRRGLARTVRHQLPDHRHEHSQSGSRACAACASPQHHHAQSLRLSQRRRSGLLRASK